jgi:hypothetical protein
MDRRRRGQGSIGAVNELLEVTNPWVGLPERLNVTGLK